MSSEASPPRMRQIHSRRLESAEKIAGFPAYELVYDPDRSPKLRHPWRLNARAHGRSSTTWHQNTGNAVKWARDDWARAAGEKP